MNEDSISLNKYISQTGICSRREADKMIEAGRVKINDAVAVKGNRVFENDKVLVDEKPLKLKKNNVYILLNKPPGITCTTDLKDPSNIIDFMDHPERIFPIGRLDKPSSGLILLTNDGDIVNDILREEYDHEKEYLVRVNNKITPEFIEKMSAGIPMLGTVTKKCRVIKKSDYEFKIILTQGLNRQIRRMCEYMDYKVVNLKRTRIMHIKFAGLSPGEWRDLTEAELATLRKKIKISKA